MEGSRSVLDRIRNRQSSVFAASDSQDSMIDQSVDLGLCKPVTGAKAWTNAPSRFSGKRCSNDCSTPAQPKAARSSAAHNTPTRKRGTPSASPQSCRTSSSSKKASARNHAARTTAAAAPPPQQAQQHLLSQLHTFGSFNSSYSSQQSSCFIYAYDPEFEAEYDEHGRSKDQDVGAAPRQAAKGWPTAAATATANAGLSGSFAMSLDSADTLSPFSGMLSVDTSAAAAVAPSAAAAQQLLSNLSTATQQQGPNSPARCGPAGSADGHHRTHNNGSAPPSQRTANGCPSEFDELDGAAAQQFMQCCEVADPEDEDYQDEFFRTQIMVPSDGQEPSEAVLVGPDGHTHVTVGNTNIVLGGWYQPCRACQQKTCNHHDVAGTQMAVCRECAVKVDAVLFNRPLPPAPTTSLGTPACDTVKSAFPRLFTYDVPPLPTPGHRRQLLLQHLQHVDGWWKEQVNKAYLEQMMSQQPASLLELLLAMATQGPGGTAGAAAGR